MKVAAFIFNLSKGGAQGVFVNLVNYLHEKGMDVSVITYNLDDPVYQADLNEDIPITVLGAGSTKDALFKIKKYVSENTFDYAVGFSAELAVNLVIARSLTKKKFKIVGRCINTLSVEYKYVSSFFRKYITHNMVKMFYHKVDYAIAQSVGMGEDLVDNYGFKKEQVKVINNAMNPLFEEESKNESAVYQRDNSIIYVGRLEQQKGLKMLLHAFSGLEDKTIKLKLIGSGSMLDELESLATELHINDKVIFIEHTKEIMEYYKSARATIMSSYFEGFPNVLVESIACGTPVVSFDLPSGPNEIIIEGVNGYLSKYLDVEDLTDKINKALKFHWDANAIKLTAKRYDRETIMNKYLSVFKEGE